VNQDAGVEEVGMVEFGLDMLAMTSMIEVPEKI
jgi:hypothetical protein